MQPLPASRLGILKDVAVFVLAVVFIGSVLVWFLPGAASSVLSAVQNRYVEDQRIELVRTVDATARRIADQDQRLAQAGLSPLARTDFLLASLKDQRFGPGGFGYFFLYEDAGPMLLHPVFPELVGKPVKEVVSPDGVNLGELFEASLRGRNAAFVEYNWVIPGKPLPERKSSYLSRVAGRNWVLGSGSYLSDFQAIRDDFLVASRASLVVTWLQALGMALIVVAISIVLDALLYRRVRQMEVDLSRQIARLEQYKLILDKSSAVSRTTPDGTITFVNDKFCEVTGYTRSQALGSPHSIERHPGTPPETFRELWETISGGRVWQGTLRNLRADGTPYLKLATIVPIVDEKGAVVEYLSSGHDITEAVENREKLQTAAMTDPLTGLANRSLLVARLDRPVSHCLALVDVADFSEINRLFGQSAGDEVLRALARVLVEATGDSAIEVCRFHADTFALVVEGAELEPFVQRVQALADSLRAFSVDFHQNRITPRLRFGIGHGDRDALLYADEALRRARRRRASVVVHDPTDGVTASVASRLRVLDALRWALENRRVLPVFQPIVPLLGEGADKFECLMRIEDAEGRTLRPGEFIPVAKAMGLYLSLSRELFRRAIAAARSGTFDFSLNLTMEDLQSPETMEFLLDEVRRAGVGPRLILELVETEELEVLDQGDSPLEVFRNEGVRLAVDDFGSGYSNFDYLLKLSPAFVKIDGSIVQKLTTDHRARELVESIVSFSRRSRMKTVAEFLDSKELVELVTKLGVDYGQGWFLGKAGPLPKRPASATLA